MRPLIKFPTIKEDTNTHVHSKNHNFCWLRTQVVSTAPMSLHYDLVSYSDFVCLMIYQNMVFFFSYVVEMGLVEHN